MVDPEIPPPSKEQISQWASKIIRSNNLTSREPIDQFELFVKYFFEKQFEGFVFDSYQDKEGELNFYAAKREDGGGSAVDDFLDDFLPVANFDEPMTEEGKMLAKYAELTFTEILGKLNILTPKQQEKMLEQLQMKALDKVPNFKESIFQFWAGKIIEYNKITKKSKISEIIKNSIQFFDVLLKKYRLVFLPSKLERFPVYTNRIDDNSLGWASEIDKIEKLLYSTYYSILKKLNRIADYPKDPNFWFNLVIVYETIGESDKASKFGDYGLELNPTDSNYLMELVIFYGENKRYIHALKYLKKTGLIFIDQELYDRALDVWKRVVNFERNEKDNWLKLALVLSKLGNETEAEQCRLQASQL